jgi:DNA-binding beta-propeller fold protein YncE
VPDVLLAETDTGLATVSGGRYVVLGHAVATPDGSRVYATEPLNTNGTTLSTIDAASGRVTAQARLSGTWVPRVTSPDGNLVALSDPAPSGGRARTTIVVAESHGERKRLELTGNYEPDAFARANTGLCLLEWLPPLAPDRYRVKLFGLEGDATGLFTRDKVPIPPGSEQEMRGERRQAAYGPAYQVLYTLYTHQPGVAGAGWDEETDAFVHTLDLTIGWAYCLDLPAPFGTGPGPAHTVAVTPDGRWLLVADLNHGRLAYADTDQLVVRSVVPIPTGTGSAYATVSPDNGRLYLGIGPTIHVIDLVSRRPVGRWEAGGEVHGLALSPDGHRLLTGYPGGVGWRDASSGVPLGRAAVPGLTRLIRAV